MGSEQLLSIDISEDKDGKKQSKRNERHRIPDKSIGILETECRFYVENREKDGVERKCFYEEGRELRKMYFLYENIEDWGDAHEIEEIVVRVIESLLERC